MVRKVSNSANYRKLYTNSMLVLQPFPIIELADLSEKSTTIQQYI